MHFSKNNMIAEKREHFRFLEDITVVAFWNNSINLGKLKDISKAGMAFEYITDEKPKKKNSQINIFLSGNKFHLSNLPCKIVYDILIRKEKYQSNKLLMTRRCGVKFKKPTTIQTKQLEFFQKIHTNNEQFTRVVGIVLEFHQLILH